MTFHQTKLKRGRSEIVMVMTSEACTHASNGHPHLLSGSMKINYENEKKKKKKRVGLRVGVGEAMSSKNNVPKKQHPFMESI